MGKITTEEILNRYFDSIKDSHRAIIKLNREKLYAYEKKIGKAFIDMNVDDLFGLIIEFRNKRKGKEISYMVSHSSFDQLSSLFRSIFDWYIDNVEVIKNPFNDRRIKGREATERLAKDKEPFNWDIVENVIKKLHVDREQDYADYIELIILMYYNGFFEAEEIVRLQDYMIDHENHTVKLPDRTIHLSQRCYELLKKFHSMETIENYNRTLLLASWNGSYFKFPIRPNKEYEFNERSVQEMCNNINRMLAVYVNDKYDIKFNYYLLYFLGFYDYIVAKYGEERTNEILLSYRDPEDTKVLMNVATEYGVKVKNITRLKRQLRLYVKTE